MKLRATAFHRRLRDNQVQKAISPPLAESASNSSVSLIRMAERAHDWFRQAESDLRMAHTARDAGHYEWSAFACHQAAEKAIKAVFQRLHKEAWGHVLIALLDALPETARPGAELWDRARVLDRHYIPTRYPNGFERGAPVDFYSQKDAGEAIGHAEAILAFCRNQIS
jgi:HEPN domain-containing protein